MLPSFAMQSRQSYSQLGELEKTIFSILRAAEQAEAWAHPREALEQYSAALSFLEQQTISGMPGLRADVYGRIGDLYRRVGDVARSRDAYLLALDALNHEGGTAERPARKALHRKLVLNALLEGDMPAAAEHLVREYAMLEFTPREEARWLVLQALYEWCGGGFSQAVGTAGAALALADSAGAEPESSQAREMLALAHLALGQWEEGLRHERARSLARWSPEIVTVAEAQLCLFDRIPADRISYRRAEEWIGEAGEAGAVEGQTRYMAICHYAIGSMALQRGHLQTAARELERALDLHRRLDSALGVVHAAARRTNVLTALGDLSAGWELVRQARPLIDKAPIRAHATAKLAAAGIWNRLDAGDLTGAAGLADLVRPFESGIWACPSCSRELFPTLAAFHLACDNLERASLYTERMLHWTQMHQDRVGHALAQRTQAEVLATQGRLVEAQRSMAQAVAVFQQLEHRYNLARTLLAWAQLPINVLIGEPPTTAKTAPKVIRSAGGRSISALQ